MPAQVGEKSFVVAWVLSLLLGGLGIDRFYLGKVGTGILKLITFGGLGIWYLIDLIIILTNSARDKDGDKLSGYKKNKTLAIVVTIVFFFVFIGIGAASGGNQSTINIDSIQQSDTKKETSTEAKDDRLTLDEGWSLDRSNPYMTQVLGTVSNNSDEEIKGYIQISFSALDAEKANVGDCLANANTVDAHGKWKFKAMCSGDNIDTVRFKDITGF